jgi:hypothetical protein
VPTNTPKYGLPIPATGDLPSGPIAVGALATAIDSLGIVGGKRTTAAGASIVSIEQTVCDTQTLLLPANSVFLIEFYLCFTVAVVTNVDMKIRMTSVSGPILAETCAIGTYVAPEPNFGFLRLVYKTTSNSELDYFAGTAIIQGTGIGPVTPIVPTSVLVFNCGPSTIIGDY